MERLKYEDLRSVQKYGSIFQITVWRSLFRNVHCPGRRHSTSFRYRYSAVYEETQSRVCRKLHTVCLFHCLYYCGNADHALLLHPPGSPEAMAALLQFG